MRPVAEPRLLLLLMCAVFSLSLVACSTTAGGVGAGVYVGDEHHAHREPPPHSKGGPPPHAPAHGYRAKHSYHYYPDSYVYFDVSEDLYFYLEGDDWRVSASLPGHLRLQIGDYVVIESDSDAPYSHHDEHKKKYPPGHKKGKKDKKDKKHKKHKKEDW